MFQWYRDAEICYAYLEDVTARELAEDPFSACFTKSRWFTRGWTLQELIAPPRLLFFGGDWQEIGSRSKLVNLVAKTTGIDAALFDHGTLGKYSIAQRMSWAARRHTTRVEDEAYCLMGLFSVTMPLVYGEGKMAFTRLQEEIMRRSDDQSIFAWTSSAPHPVNHTGMLADSPADFAESGHIKRVEQERRLPPYAITNKGIQIHLPLILPEANYTLPMARAGGGSGVRLAFTPSSTLAVLSCHTSGSNNRIGIYLDRTHPLQPYYRSDHSLGLVSVPAADAEENATLETILVRVSEPRDEKPLWPTRRDEQLIIVKSLPAADSGFRLARTLPDPGGKSSWATSESGVMAIRLDKSDYRRRASLLFTNEARANFCLFLEPSENTVVTSLLSGLSDEAVKDFERERLSVTDWSKESRRQLTVATRKDAEDVRPGFTETAVTIDVEMRPHAALVHIRADSKATARKRAPSFVDVFSDVQKRIKVSA